MCNEKCDIGYNNTVFKKYVRNDTRRMETINENADSLQKTRNKTNKNYSLSV